MDSNELNRWLVLAANIGVLLGLALVIYEIRQNSDLMKVQISQARADAAMVSNQQTYESAYIPTILVTIQQYQFGMLGEHIPRAIEDFARATIWQSAYSREAWKITRPGYSDQYVAFIESMSESELAD